MTGQLATAVCLGMHCLNVVKQECRLTTHGARMAVVWPVDLFAGFVGMFMLSACIVHPSVVASHS